MNVPLTKGVYSLLRGRNHAAKERCGMGRTPRAFSKEGAVEVEAVAAAHPGVLEAAAIAQPDEHSGEVVALFVVRKDPALTEKDIIEHSRKSLAGYKVPKHVYFRSELPKSNVGKILRKALREELGRA